MTSTVRKATLVAMKIFIVLSLLLLVSCTRHAEAKRCGQSPIRIAVIDTGFGFQDKGHEANLCQYGHKDFSVYGRQFTKNYATKDPVPLDADGHGTNIAGIIDGYMKQAHANYCLVIIKYYLETQTNAQNILSTTRAFNYAANIHADYINFSGGGPGQSTFEKAAVERYLNHGGHLIAAAGNNHEELKEPHTPDEIKDTYYPAMYDERIVVVGNLRKEGGRSKTSNFGNLVTRWEVGENVEAFGLTYTGTSQATAVATGKIAAENSNKCDIGR